jgi:hypothetical protein
MGIASGLFYGRSGEEENVGNMVHTLEMSLHRRNPKKR